jgi:hypothetical protein
MTTQVKIQNGMYVCLYCDREYKIFDNYRKHQIPCEFFHKTRKERCQDRESLENVPSQRAMLRIIQDLALRCNRLETEVRNLKNVVASKKRKEVVEYLNHLPSPEMTFQNWTEQQNIEFHHLECVFEKNLTEGLKMCIGDQIPENALKLTIPISAFEQRPGVMYIYDDSDNIPTWKKMEAEVFEKWITTLSHRFLQYFIEWQSDNLDRLSTDQDKEDNIMYMIKVNGGRNPVLEKERRISELKKWLFSKIQIPIASFVEIV